MAEIVAVTVVAIAEDEVDVAEGVDGADATGAADTVAAMVGMVAAEDTSRPRSSREFV